MQEISALMQQAKYAEQVKQYAAATEAYKR
jgi:hypothetical protein